MTPSQKSGESGLEPVSSEAYGALTDADSELLDSRKECEDKVTIGNAGGGGAAGTVVSAGDYDWFEQLAKLMDDLLTSPELEAGGVARREALNRLGEMVSEALKSDDVASLIEPCVYAASLFPEAIATGAEIPRTHTGVVFLRAWLGRPSNILPDWARGTPLAWFFDLKPHELSYDRQGDGLEPWNEGRPLPRLTTFVHGTAPRDLPTEWWRPGSVLPQEIDGRVDGGIYKFDDYFAWSGINSSGERTAGAEQLIAWVRRHLTRGGELCLVAHSHGGNVAIEASRRGLTIHKLVLLGTPIRTDYMPDMSNVHEIWNVYSPHDRVQWWGAQFRARFGGRSLPPRAHVENVSIATDGVAPHTAVHDWDVWTQPENQLDARLFPV